MTDTVERVPIADVRDLVRAGEPLPFRVLDAQGRLLLGAGQTVVGERQVEQLIERGAWAEKPAVVAARAARAGAAGPAASASRARPTHFDTGEALVWQLDALLRGLVAHRATAADLDVLVDRLDAWVERDPDIALFGCMRQDDRRFALYGVTHALHTAVLAGLAAGQLGWPADRRRSLARAALTMNLSITELQASMAEQGEPPTPAQRQALHAHPLAATVALREAGVDDATALLAVAQHHEQPGGGGYPRGLAEPDAVSRLLRCADIFMAKVTPRARRPAMLPIAATRELFQLEPDKALATGMIRTLGVHAPGSVVLLRSGQAAVVARRGGGGHGIRVCTLSDARGRPSAQGSWRDTAKDGDAIVGPHPEPGLFGRILPERVYGLVDA